jgi:hypothetical protein
MYVLGVIGLCRFLEKETSARMYLFVKEASEVGGQKEDGAAGGHPQYDPSGRQAAAHHPLPSG